MCGFAGFLGGDGSGSADATMALLRRMADVILHRGPDSGGEWCDVDAQIGFGYRRLAILDLSEAGHQPMASPSGRYVISFNGEVYNHQVIRLALAGEAPHWRGHSDTETLVAAFDVWGIEETVRRTIGMFAFAVWDKKTRTLTLGRDRLGEKPLYYGWQGTGREAVFLFGSELKALKAHPGFHGALDRDALCLFLRHDYIPAPHSIYQGISKLAPGSLLRISLEKRELEPKAYWSLEAVALGGIAEPFCGTADEAVLELEKLLLDAIGKQMVADVPLGAFLSGGVDSSTIVSLMQVQSTRPVKTFTIGFREAGFNEAEYAKAVAAHLGTEHTELYMAPEDARAVIPLLPSLYDEPFADSSQIPTFLVAQLARQHVTVSLSGDAGDELFCGYNRYLFSDRMWGRMSRVPRPMRQLMAGGLRGLSVDNWNRLISSFGKTLPGSLRRVNAGDKIHKGAALLASPTQDALYLGLNSNWANPEGLVIGGHEPATLLNGLGSSLDSLAGIERMMALDAKTYLPDDILVKVDRASMGVSLESRVPFLDHRVVEFAWSLPQDYKLRNGVTKWPIRQVLNRHVPAHLIERPKMGFGVPIGAWLRGPLRPWAEELLDPARLAREGVFQPQPILVKWREHLKGTRNWERHLWDILMFQAWMDEWHPT